MNTANFFPLASDWILWPQLKKALKYILIGVLSIYLKLSTCLSAALSRNTFSDWSLVFSLFLLMFSFPQIHVNNVLLTVSGPGAFYHLQWTGKKFYRSLCLDTFFTIFCWFLVSVVTFSFKTEWLSCCFWREVLCLVIVYNDVQIIYWPVVIKPMLKECFHSWLCVLKCLSLFQ